MIVDSRAPIPNPYEVDASSEQDDILMARIQATADGVAFERLHQRNRAWVAQLLTGMGVGRNDIDDCLQEIFWRVFRRALRYEPRGQFHAWLRVVAKRMVLKFRASRHLPVADPSTCYSRAAPVYQGVRQEDAKAVADKIIRAFDALLDRTGAGFRERKARGLLRCLSRLLHEADHLPADPAWLFPEIGRWVMGAAAFGFLNTERVAVQLDGLRRLGKIRETMKNMRLGLRDCGLRPPNRRIWQEFVTVLKGEEPSPLLRA